MDLMHVHVCMQYMQVHVHIIMCIRAMLKNTFKTNFITKLIGLFS